MTTTPSSSSPVNNLLIVVILILLGQIVWQQSKVWRLEAQVAQATRDVDDRAARIALERMQGRREDLVRAVDWLQQFYKSEEGLRRPNGLWIAEQNKVDAEAMGAWIFDFYMNRRVSGATEEEARKAVIDAIRGTDEWQRVHKLKP
ncbi:MAG: hypothetical protein ACRD2N_18295 [Vicinamibacterales bacterium]